MALTARRPAAPIPATPLPASIMAMFCAPVLMALPIMKNTTASWRAQWRPNMSATDAKGGKNTVDVRRYIVPM